MRYPFSIAVGLVLSGALASFCAEGPMTWGGRESHPAVVNPVLPQENVISLRGEWEFSRPAKDRPNRNGIWNSYCYREKWDSPRKIQVPGCWEHQGVGEPGPSECWEPKWDCNDKPIRHKYMGEGWYRRTVDIPAAWKGRRIWIKIGGVKSVGWVWVNDRQVAYVANYCGTEKFEITDLVEPGKPAKIVLDVDNRRPSRKGLMSAMHKWGGIYRDIELEATPMECYIDDAWVRGDFDKRLARVEVEIEGGGGQRSEDLSLRATVEGETVQMPLSTSTSSLHLEVPLRNFRAWSPEHPNLYTAKVELVENGAVVQTRWERFGVRKIEVWGNDFRLNGKPFYVRGFGDDHVYPLTGLTPADRDVHRAHLAKARAAGFNFVRLHTHCEIPEYFEAADELGIMIQPELPYYSDVAAEGFDFDPARDVTELWRNYRRHPSFAVYSMGNEGSFGEVLDRRLHAYVKAMDPDRLKINQDCHNQAINTPENSDYAGGPTREWPRGTFNPGRPFVTHEYLNLCVKSDARSEDRYTGVWMPPAKRADRAAWLKGFGLDAEWGDRLQDAQHALQAVWQKHGIEAARADPFCDGHIFWTIVDVVVWNDAVKCFSAQGLFDPFWSDKPRGLTAKDFAVFNSPSCVLADFRSGAEVYAAGDTLEADVLFAHYGDEPLVRAKAEWTLSAAGGVLASGAADIGDQPLGAVRKVATARLAVPAVPRPTKASLTISVTSQTSQTSQTFSNTWDVWLFPRRAVRDGSRICVAEAFRGKLAPRYRGLLPADRAAEAAVVVAPEDSDLARAARQRGQKLVTLDGCDGKPNVKLGWWWMGTQVGTALKDHPALGGFPHEGVLSPLLFRLVKEGKELKGDIPSDEMIVVGEGGTACYVYLSEHRAGGVLSAHGLDLLSDTPEGAYLLDAFIDYLTR